MRIKREWEERAQGLQARTQRTFEHTDAKDEGAADENPEEAACTLFSLPPSAEPPLEAWHIREAFAQLQRDRRLLETGRRTAGPTGGLRRTQVFVI